MGEHRNILVQDINLFANRGNREIASRASRDSSYPTVAFLPSVVDTPPNLFEPSILSLKSTTVLGS